MPSTGKKPKRILIKRSIVIIAAVIIALYFYCTYDSTKHLIECKNPSDPLCPDKYFSDNYTEARNRFISVSSTIKNANIYHLPIYKLLHKKEEKEDDYLYTDITIINENSKSNHLLIHISGTHGIEGYAGSPVQYCLLEYISNITNNQETNKLFENYTLQHSVHCNADQNDVNGPIIIFIHALNPFGFHFDRRFNENNVDLNRNYKTKQQWNELINDDKNGIKDIYESLDDLFNPKYDLKYIIQQTDKLPSSKFLRCLMTDCYYLTYLLSLAYYAISVGQPTISKAGASGQWYNPKGLQYNGEPFKLEESHKKLKYFLQNTLIKEKHSEWKEQINKISFIDIHSGYGPYAEDILISTDLKSYNKIQKLMPIHANNNLTTLTSNFVDGAYEYANGYSSQHVESLMDDDINRDNLFVNQEFGTYAGHWVFAGMAFENSFTQSYNQYIHKKELKDEINDFDDKLDHLLNIAKKKYKNLFYCQYVDWKTQILKRGFDLFAQVFNR